MADCVKYLDFSASEDGIRAVLSLRESALLADIPEGPVRKDIERGDLPRKDHNRLFFFWNEVVALAAAYRPPLPPTMRREVWSKVLEMNVFADRLHIDDRYVRVGSYLLLEIESILRDVAPRIKLYHSGLSKVAEKPDLLGGEAVFSGTRLPVMHIGGMAARGEPIDEIVSDYPYLTEDDVKFARLYFTAHPPIGRPRTRTEVADGPPTAR